MEVRYLGSDGAASMVDHTVENVNQSHTPAAERIFTFSRGGADSVDKQLALTMPAACRIYADS